MNFIKIYKKQIPDSFCDKLIDIYKFNDKCNYTHTGKSGTNSENNLVKNSRDLDLEIGKVLGPSAEEPLTQELFIEMFSFINKPIMDYVNTFIPNRDGKQNYLTHENSKELFTLLQPPKLKRYIAPEQGYHAWHQDWGLLPEQIQRLLVIMFYLNDVEEGGETSFFHQNLKIKPEKGKLVIFPPYFTHMHKGEIPISNNKYICNCYIGLNPSQVG